MSTNPQGAPSEDDAQLERLDDEADTLLQLLEELDNIDENAGIAPLNRSSMSDNNGGRIQFITRYAQRLSAFLFMRRLFPIPRRVAKSEQEDRA